MADGLQTYGGTPQRNTSSNADAPMRPPVGMLGARVPKAVRKRVKKQSKKG